MEYHAEAIMITLETPSQFLTNHCEQLQENLICILDSYPGLEEEVYDQVCDAVVRGFQQMKRKVEINI